MLPLLSLELELLASLAAFLFRLEDGLAEFLEFVVLVLEGARFLLRLGSVFEANSRRRREAVALGEFLGGVLPDVEQVLVGLEVDGAQVGHVRLLGKVLEFHVAGDERFEAALDAAGSVGVDLRKVGAMMRTESGRREDEKRTAMREMGTLASLRRRVMTGSSLGVRTRRELPWDRNRAVRPAR